MNGEQGEQELATEVYWKTVQHCCTHYAHLYVCFINIASNLPADIPCHRYLRNVCQTDFDN